MYVVVGNQPSVPAAFEPSALHEVPFQRATLSACAIPAMFFMSAPTYTFVPTAVTLRTNPLIAPAPPPGADPSAAQLVPSNAATLSAAVLAERFEKFPPA